MLHGRAALGWGLLCSVCHRFCCSCGPVQQKACNAAGCCCHLHPLRRAQENNRDMNLVQMCLVCLAQLMWAIVEYLT